MLWIFTQDKQRLINVNEVIVKGKKLAGMVRSSTLDVAVDLGKYKSNERALEILNEIFLEMKEYSGCVSLRYAMPEK